MKDRKCSYIKFYLFVTLLSSLLLDNKWSKHHILCNKCIHAVHNHLLDLNIVLNPFLGIHVSETPLWMHRISVYYRFCCL